MATHPNFRNPELPHGFTVEIDVDMQIDAVHMELIRLRDFDHRTTENVPMLGQFHLPPIVTHFRNSMAYVSMPSRTCPLLVVCLLSWLVSTVSATDPI
ncbi:MAG: hypothetical protein JWN70_2054, partial [Planctomycetaceae bacterium]|nr:hypothetical protein [Planctomycetaceae bacterium]